jgi:SAM-dependent methyltransferase
MDVGAGVGSLLPDLRAAFPNAGILGVDRSLGMLSLADGAACRAVMDAGRLGFKSCSMDLLLMVFMLFHLESPALGLREARRLLRDGGRLGVVTWGGEFESRATLVWTECLDGFIGAPEPATAANDAFDTPEKMEMLLRSAGYARARAWMEELAYTIEPEHLLRLRTTVGSQRPRFESLDAALQLECLTQVRRKLNQLAPEDFVARGNIVYSVGYA